MSYDNLRNVGIGAGVLNAAYGGMPDHLAGPPARLQCLAMRLRMRPDEVRDKYNGLNTTHVAHSPVFVTFIKDGKLVVFEDDAGLFPSDTLITALRLVE